MLRRPYVLFDLGETLVDLTDLVASIARRLRVEHPRIVGVADETARVWIRRTSEFLPREAGAPFVREIDVAASVLRDLLEARGVPIDVGEAESLLRRSWDDFEARVRLCPGVTKEWLRGLRPMAEGMGIVTDGDSVNVERLVKRLRLDEYFGAIVTSESVRAYKPSPRIYEAGLQALGAEPRRSVFVSDTPLDLRGAAAVGMRTAFLPRGLLSEPVRLPSGAMRLKEPRDLNAVLKAMTT